MTILWDAATFIFVEMTIDASAAIILVPAAACGDLPSTRRVLACSSTSCSSDESFGTYLEHARNVMELCSFKTMAEVLAQQPVLCGAVVLVRACAVV